MDIDNLRPWEYDAMSAWDYDEILMLQEAWRSELNQKPAVRRGEGVPAPLPILEGRGPQFAPRRGA